VGSNSKQKNNCYGNNNLLTKTVVVVVTTAFDVLRIKGHDWIGFTSIEDRNNYKEKRKNKNRKQYMLVE